MIDIDFAGLNFTDAVPFKAERPSRDTSPREGTGLSSSANADVGTVSVVVTPTPKPAPPAKPARIF